jgi:hypothetical protein
MSLPPWARWDGSSELHNCQLLSVRIVYSPAQGKMTFKLLGGD